MLVIMLQLQRVLQTANTLNNALVVTDPSSLTDSFYLALVRSLVGSDQLVYGAIIVLEPAHGNGNPSSQTPYVFRDPSTGHLQVNKCHTFLLTYLLFPRILTDRSSAQMLCNCVTSLPTAY